MNRIARVLQSWADDLCMVVGASLIGVGVFQVCPVATWFYAGTVLVVAGVLIARGGQ